MFARFVKGLCTAIGGLVLISFAVALLAPSEREREARAVTVAKETATINGAAIGCKSVADILIISIKAADSTVDGFVEAAKLLKSGDCVMISDGTKVLVIERDKPFMLIEYRGTEYWTISDWVN